MYVYSLHISLSALHLVYFVIQLKIYGITFGGVQLWDFGQMAFIMNGLYLQLLCYISYSLYFFSLLKHNRIKSYKLIIALSTIIATIAIFNDTIIDNWHFLLLYRIPIFLYGALTAYYLTNNYSSKKFIWVALCGLIIFIGFFVVPASRTRYIAFTFLTPILLSVFCLLIKNTTIINKLGGVIGKASLEIYLVHLIFLKYLRTNTISIREVFFDLSTVGLTVISVFIGIILHKLITKCIHI